VTFIVLHLAPTNEWFNPDEDVGHAMAKVFKFPIAL
jgi:hypothetical protein